MSLVPPDPTLAWGGIILRTDIHAVAATANPKRWAKITPCQTVLLTELLRARGAPRNMEALIMALWSAHQEPADPTGNIRVHISRLRLLLRRLGWSGAIGAEWAVGYRLVLADEDDAPFVRVFSRGQWNQLQRVLDLATHLDRQAVADLRLALAGQAS